VKVPILFVTQMPYGGNPFARIGSNFGNHWHDSHSAPRGGDLWIAYANGEGPAVLRNLSAEAGLGNDIAVRDPSVHWDGQKALVSVLKGSDDNARWQVYSVEGFAQSDTDKPKFTRLPQPADYNNISPIYDSQDKVVMVSDMPRGGPGAEYKHLYPQLDEYDEAASNTGIWRLDPSVGAQGHVTQLHHAPSGAFRPQIDSFGRIIFTNWDHLQRDQQSGDPQQGLFNWPDELPGTPRDPGPDTGQSTTVQEVFPEQHGDTVANGVRKLKFNHFLPWMLRQDGTDAETLNHIGRHELGIFGFASRVDVPNQTPFGLSDLEGASGAVNGPLVNQGIKLNMLHYLREDPLKPGAYLGVRLDEFGPTGGGCVITLQGEPSRRPQDMKVTLITSKDSCGAGGQEAHRSPLPTNDGRILSSVTVAPKTTYSGTDPLANYRLYFLRKNGSTYERDPAAALTPGLRKTIGGQAMDADFWEWDPVEVRVRTRPTFTAMDPIATPEDAMFTQAGVEPQKFRKFLADNKLALIVSRNVTRRDAFDRQQPYNLHVRGGVQSVLPGSDAKVWDIDHLQIFQAEQLRGIKNEETRGRRVLPQPMKPLAVNGKPVNPPADAAPVGSARVASDGSVAAIVRADRATTWQLVDSVKPGEPKLGTDGIVRERFWLSFRPGEVRVCATCHGVSQRDQTEPLGTTQHAEVTNPPAALRLLLDHYKANFEGLAASASVPTGQRKATAHR
jgi:hypothetical protein